ncbi:Uncharacterised protein [Mycobacteroides abscessus subsp. abscessus]|nr:Uncharacterised protein [Mycobacteroides abscessus subsp. abscessus]
MNSPDLNSACAMTWRAAAAIAASVPTPMTAVMSPSWETVEYAMSFFTSCWLRANQPPMKAVMRPADTRMTFHAGVAWKAGEKRIMRKMPALTTAAAWR